MSGKRAVVGSQVRVLGVCRCRSRPPGGDMPWHDSRDCYHKSAYLSRVFADGVSFWVINRAGYGCRVSITDVVSV